jgi:Carboxypeptidase regulatory-like domain
MKAKIHFGMLRNRVVTTALLLTTISFPSSRLFAQTIVTGEISGTVSDPAGGLIVNTTVSAKSEAYGNVRTATTDSQGAFRISLLPPGAYDVSVTAPGFQPAKAKVAVSLGQVTAVPIKLSVQQTSETVQVTSEAPLLQNDNANSTTNFNSLQLEQLPTPGNDMTAYAFQAPGSTVSTGGGYGNFTSFGMPATSNSFTVNGSDNMDPYLNLNNSGASNLTLGSNEIQEAVVVTNGYTGQYGRQSGAQVNYVTKSGSNEFHGNASWWWNGSMFNANDFFNNQQGVNRPHAVSNQWAGNFGGPVKKNKLFFFADNEGLRYVLPSGGPIFIPTTGFSTYVLNNIKAVNPSAAPFYNNILNLYSGASGAARAVPVTADVDPSLGCGDFAGTAGYGVTLPCARQFQSTVNNLNTEWLLATRADYVISASDRVYFRFWTDHGVQATGTDAINSAFNANSVQPAYTGQVGYTKSFGPAMVNNLLLSGLYYSAQFGPPNLAAALAVFPTTMGFSDGLFSQLGGGANPTGVGDNNYPSGRNVAQWQIVDDFAYTHGQHEFKFGINFRHDQVGDSSYGPGTSGFFNIASMSDFVNGALANGSTYAQSFTRIGSEKISLFSAGIYAQDQWKATPKLTVTAAIRFEIAGNPSCARNCFDGLNSTFENLNHAASQPYNSAISLGMPNAFRNLGGFVVQPRFGFAYSANDKTVIRVGVGVFADQFAGTLASRFFTNTPNVASFTTTSGIIAPGVAGSAFGNVANSNAALQAGFGGGATLAQLQASVPGFALPNLFTQADQFNMPRYLEWNFEVQRQLTSRLVLSENYVGNHGVYEINQNPFLNAYSPSGFGGLPKTPADSRFGEINELDSTGRSNYDGLVSSLRFRFSSSLIGQVNYTWSHALDDCSDNCLQRFNLLTAPSYRYQFNPAGPAAQNYGNADYDTRHSFSANYVWTVPGKYQNGFAKAVLGGWTVSETFLAHSAYPFSVVNSGLRSAYISNSSGVATISVIADWIGGSSPNSCVNVTIACFTASEFQTRAKQADFGNLARNSFRGLGYFDTDINVNKAFSVRERFRFVIGANFFNILNHANFDLPVNNVALGNFGSINSTVSPPSSPYGSFTGSAVSGRVIQGNLKFQF